MECVFCKILAGEIPADFQYQDEELVAFPDINPLAPTHLLIIPREHISSLNEITEATSSLIARMVNVSNGLAKREGIDKNGYRLVINCGPEGGQLVPHLHMHLIGGRKLSDTLG